MSHVESGPLAGYNSLMDPNLSGYFGNTRMRRHLKKSGLVNRRGEIISEATYRLNMARKEHKKHVRDLLAQAIVHKTLDMERSRQVAIRQKIEEIAKIEMVKRIRGEPSVWEEMVGLMAPPKRKCRRTRNNNSQTGGNDRGRKGDEDVLPYLTPRKNSRPSSVPSGGRRGSGRPASGKHHSSRKRSSSQGSDGHIYIDDEGRPINPPLRERSESPDVEYERSHSRGRGKKGSKESKYPKGEVDDRQLYALDQRTLREYTMAQSHIDRGMGPSPYSMPAYNPEMAPSPPQGSPRSTGRRSRRGKKDKSQKSTGNQGTLLLHRQEPAMKHQERVQTLCEVSMHYFGSTLKLDYEKFDPRDDVLVEQQHCGGNTLHVFKEKIMPGSDFTFTSRRHRGYPFSLTFYVNGTLDCRLSACCEYKHQKGSRLGGSKGHFGMLGVKGAAPCYKCQVAEGSKTKKEKKKRTKKSEKKQEDEEKETVEVPVDDEDEQREQNTQRDIKVKGMKDENETERDRKTKGDSVQIAVEEDAHDDTHRDDREEEEAYGDDFEDEDDEEDKNQQVTSKGQAPSYSDDEDFEDAKSGSSRSSSRSSRSRSRSSSSRSSSRSSRSSRSRSSSSDTPRKETKKSKSNEAKDQPAPSKEVQNEHEEEPETAVMAAPMAAAPQRRDSVSSSSSSSSSSSDEQSARPDPVTVSPKEAQVKSPSPEPVKQEIEDTEVQLKGTESELSASTPQTAVEDSTITQDPAKMSTDNVYSTSPLTHEALDSDSHSSDSDSSDGSKSESSTSRDREPESVELTTKQEPVLDKPVATGGVHNDVVKKNAKDETEPAENPKPRADNSSDERASKSEGSTDEESGSESSGSDTESDSEENGPEATKTDGNPKEKDQGGPSTPNPSDTDQDGGHDADGVTKDETPRPFPANEVGTKPGESLEGSIRSKVEDQHDVDLSGIGLTKEQVSELVDLLKTHDDMELLSLRNCGIDNEDLKEISDAIVENSCDLKMLNLTCSKINEESVDWVVEIIREKKDLEILLLSGVPLGDEGMEKLVDGLIDIHIQRLGDEASIPAEQLRAIKEAAHGMVANVITDVLASSSVPSVASTTSEASEGTQQLISKMEENKAKQPQGVSLRHLDLGDCAITDTGIKHIAKLVAANVGLTKLELSGNKNISENGWQMLADAIKTNFQLKTLSLDYSKLCDSDVAILVEALKENKTLKSLDLEGNKITNNGAKLILEFLKKDTTALCDITLMPGNKVDEDVLQEIKKVLQDRTQAS